MKPTPPGWPRISTSMYYDDPRAAIDWLCKAFGFEVALLVEGEGGRIEHSELVFGGGMVMVGGERPERMPFAKPPSRVDGANTQNLMVYVDDIDAHLARAKEAGATVTDTLETHDYGDDYWVDRGYGCKDVGGHHWWFTQRVRTKGEDV